MKANKPLEKARATSSCPCSLCESAPCKPHLQHTLPVQVIDGNPKTYTWLLEELGKLTPYTNLKLYLPETVLYRKAKVHWFLNRNRQGDLRFRTGVIKNRELRKEFIRIAGERKGADKEYGREAAVVRYMKTDNSKFQLEDEEGPLRVMTEAELTSLMDERPGSSVWKSLNYIQSTHKCRGGLGKTFIYHFTPNDMDSQVEEPESIRERCLSACQELAQYLAKYRGQKVFGWKVEFMKDDDNQLWLIHATDIKVKDHPTDFVPPPKKRHNRAVSYQYFIPEKEVKYTERHVNIQQRMNKYYERMKSKSGVEKMLGRQPDHTVSHQAFAVLRPNQSVCFEQEQSVIAERKSHRRFRSQVVVKLSPARNSTPAKIVDKSWAYHPKIQLRPIIQLNTCHLPKRSSSRLLL